MSNRKTLNQENKLKLFGIIVFMLLSIFINSAQAQSQSQKNSTRKPVTSTKPVAIQVNGQIFIVTKGGNAIKLPLITVFAYDKNDILDQILAINNSNQSKKSFLATEFISQKKRIEDVENEMNETDQKRSQAQSIWSSSLGTSSSTSNQEKYKELSAHYISLIGVKGNEQMKLNEIIQEYSSITGPRHYINKFTNQKSTGKSDIDGLYTLSILPGDYVIVATGSRSVGRSTELYSWIIEKSIKDNAEKIILSNDNIFGSNCQECIKLPE